MPRTDNRGGRRDEVRAAGTLLSHSGRRKSGCARIGVRAEKQLDNRENPLELLDTNGRIDNTATELRSKIDDAQEAVLDEVDDLEERLRAIEHNVIRIQAKFNDE